MYYGLYRTFSRSQDLQPHRRRARLDHSELLGCGKAHVDDAPAAIRPTVVDAHDHAAPVAQIDDAYARLHAQVLVRRGERVHVEALAVGGEVPVLLAPIPRCGPFLRRDDA